jgi:hypothetical protein
MVNIELLSDNLTILINEVIEIQNLCKYLKYNQKNPLSQPDLTLPATSLVLNKIHPYPFDPTTEEEDSVELRIYYPEGQFAKGSASLETYVNFDIVCAKKYWLINDEKSAIRPYMIMKCLTDHFHNKKSISTLGRVEFVNFAHLHINTIFDAIRLESSVTLFGA